MEDITAYILAGGKNSRFGTEKSLLQVGHSTILEKTISVLQDNFFKIKIVSAKRNLQEKFSTQEFIEDIYQDCGPLGGIQAALQDCQKAAFIVACDMPQLNEKLIQKQIAIFQEREVEAVIPLHSVGMEPLHAIYRRSCMLAIEKQLLRGNYSIRSFYKSIDVRYWQISEREAGCFYNINSPREYEEFKASH